MVEDNSQNFQNESFNNTNKHKEKKEYENTTQTDGFIKILKPGEVEVTFNTKKYGNPVEILDKLYPLRYDETLSNEEKNKRVQEIMREYME